MRAPNLPVLFHPDCNRRLRNRTESADPADCSEGARGLWRSLAITAGGDFHPAPRTRSDRNPTDPINAPLAKPCNDFPPAPAPCGAWHSPIPALYRNNRRSAVQTACDSCRGGTWVRTKLGRVLMRSHQARSRASASSRRRPSGANRKSANIGAACRSAKLMDLPASQGASSINPEIAARQTSAIGKAAAIRCSSGAAPLAGRETRST
jgi:hypothetical protein